jgi:hypothetical protein
MVVQVKAQPQRVAPILNTLAPALARKHAFVGFMGDDHLPRTQNWDVELTASLDGRPGVAYGNDLVQGEKLPTACIVSSDLILALGYMVPPGLEHLYFDDFWRMLGQDVGNLKYSPDVIIEHLHPTVGTAQWDASYLQNNDPAQFARDKTVYDSYLRTAWPEDLDRLKRGLHQ